jgi:TetR/AcrR family transcriptional regulator, mexJK operon transcriptional repressor
MTDSGRKRQQDAIPVQAKPTWIWWGWRKSNLPSTMQNLVNTVQYVTINFISGNRRSFPVHDSGDSDLAAAGRTTDPRGEAQLHARKDRDELTNAAGKKRRDAMVEAAYRLFVEKGYASVSVDDIIRESKGSKSSLYKFFGSKEGILKAVVESLADDMLQRISIDIPSGKSPRETLTRIGTVLVDLALSDNAINQHRQAVYNAKAFPELAKLWYESGPRRTFEGIADLLKKEAEQGRLRIANPERAALFFAGMIIFHNNMRLLVCLPRSKPSELKEIVSEAVEVFLAAYGK